MTNDDTRRTREIVDEFFERYKDWKADEYPQFLIDWLDVHGCEISKKKRKYDYPIKE